MTACACVPISQLNTEILDKLYDGYGDTSDLIPTLVAHGNAAISEMHEMDRIYRCERQYTALEAEVQNVAIEAQVGEQLSDVQSKSESYLKDQALAGFVHSSGEDSGQLFESNIRAPRADPDGSAAHMHDTVFKALSKTAAESIRVLSGAPDPLTPCLPTPDGATPGSPAVKGLPAELKKAVQSQVKKQIQPDVVCEMKLVAANTGCYGSPKYKDQYITGAEWTDEKGGQYRLRDLDLQQSMDACVADAQCQFIWMSVLDEIAARGWGSRALHECKHRPTPDHNLYEKFCLTAEEKRVTEGASLSYLQARESIVSQIKTRAGTAPFHPRTVKEVFAELDKDGDSQLSPTEMLRLSRVVDKRWGSKQRKKVEMPRPAKQKKNRRQDRFDLSEGDMLRLFDEDRDGAISQAERMVANTFMYKKTEL